VAKIFIISDTHFNHGNILQFLNADGSMVRPGFTDVEDMNETIIHNWNSVVSPVDHVYHLGDVYFGKNKNSASNRNILSRLNGKKRLILGNHDEAKDPILHEFFEKIMMWRMFPEIGALLTHVPVHESTLGEKRFEGKPMINLHGHIHNNDAPSSLHVNCSVERQDYKPRLIDDLLNEARRKS
jgi:calcineurin-like phosphoesterase family protein